MVAANAKTTAKAPMTNAADTAKLNKDKKH
jgi:hypothetical protein